MLDQLFDSQIFFEKHTQWINDIMKDNAYLGECHGVAFTRLQVLTPHEFSHYNEIEAIQLVFENGIVDARKDNLTLLAIRTLYLK